MKIKIKESHTTYTEKEIDVEFPYYYKWSYHDDAGWGVYIYGMKTELHDIKIEEKYRYESKMKEHQLTIEPRNDSYYNDNYKSDGEKFNELMNKIKEII